MMSRRDRKLKREKAKRLIDDPAGNGVFDNILNAGINFAKSDSGKQMISTVIKKAVDTAVEFVDDKNKKRSIVDAQSTAVDPSGKKQKSEAEKRQILKKLIDGSFG